MTSVSSTTGSPPSATLVNTGTAGNQTVWTTGTLADGGYAVAWMSDGASISVQRYDAAGEQSGTATPVDFDFPHASNPAVAVLGDGTMVVAYEAVRPAAGSIFPSSGIFTRHFDTTGAPVGGETQVALVPNYGAREHQAATTPAIVTWVEGGYLVAWSVQHVSSAGTSADFFVQRYDSQGQPRGEARVVGHGDVGALGFQVAALQDGGFMTSRYALDQGRLYVNFGLADSPERIGDLATMNSLYGKAFGLPVPSTLLPLDDGGFVLWSSQDGGPFMQVFDSGGEPLGPPAAAASSGALALVGGGFVVLHHDAGDQPDLLAQRHDSAGAAVGEAVRIDSNGGAGAMMTALANGDFAVTWTGRGAGGDLDVFTQLVRPGGLATGGDDRLNAKGGTDFIDGGAGTDTVVIETALAGILSYALGNGVLTVTTASGTQTLVNIERVQLPDALFAFDTHGPDGDGDGGHVWQAAALHRAAFGALPGRSDLSQWTAKADHAGSMAALGQMMIDHYAPGIGSPELVTHLYLVLLDAQPAAETVQGFVDQIGAGRTFATQGDLFAYAATLPLNTGPMAGLAGTIQQLEPDWF